MLSKTYTNRQRYAMAYVASRAKYSGKTMTMMAVDL